MLVVRKLGDWKIITIITINKMQDYINFIYYIKFDLKIKLYKTYTINVPVRVK